jgi:hypothetical protein
LTHKELKFHDGHGGQMFIAKHRIDASKKTEDKDPLPAGGEVDFVVNLSNQKAQGSQYSNVKRYILALLGYEEDDVTNEDFSATMEELLGEEGVKAQPMRGKKINTEAWNKLKKSSKDKAVHSASDYFTNHRWTHVPQTNEEIAAGRAALDAAEKKAAEAAPAK